MRSLAALLVLAAAAVVVAIAPAPAPVAPLVILGFIAVVPGALTCRVLGLPARGALAVAVVIGTGFAAVAIVSAVLLSAQVWTPARTVTVLAAISFALGAAAAGRQARSPGGVSG